MEVMVCFLGGTEDTTLKNIFLCVCGPLLLQYVGMEIPMADLESFVDGQCVCRVGGESVQDGCCQDRHPLVCLHSKSSFFGVYTCASDPTAMQFLSV